MDNLIRYSDLFESDLGEKIAELRNEVKSLMDVLNNTIEGTKGKAEELAKAFSKVPPPVKAESIKEAEKLERAIDELHKNMLSMTDVERELISISEKLKMTDNDRIKLSKLTTKMVNEQETSYNRLSATYSAIKVVLNAMTQEMREATPEGQKMVDMAKQIYEQMNSMQKSTGKYTLQVGNYERALNGLNIATNQVIRELPVLANGVSMFAIAISNNIPIFLESIERVKEQNKLLEEQREELLKNAEAMEALGKKREAESLRAQAEGIKTTSVAKSLLAIIKNYQFWVVALLAVLPGLIRKIQEKRKAQEEENKALYEGVKYQEMLNKAYQDAESAGAKDVARLRTLYSVTQDNLRSTEDRISAAKLLRKEYEENFGVMTEEEIILGRANDAYNNLTNSMLENAKARSYMDKITELYTKQIELNTKKREQDFELTKAQSKLEDELAKQRRQAEVDPYGILYGGDPYGSQPGGVALFEAAKAASEARSEVIKTDIALQEIDNTIYTLSKKLPIDGIGDEDKKRKGGEKDRAAKIANYYNDALQSIIDNMEEGSLKRYAILELGWKKEREKYEEQRNNLLEITKTGNLKEIEEAKAQLSNLEVIIRNSDINIAKSREALLSDITDSYKVAVEEEKDYDEEARQSLLSRLNAEKKLRDMALYEQFESQKKNDEGEIMTKEKLNEKLLESERKYWDDYLEMLREKGLLTVDEYNNIMAKLAKSEGGSSGSRRRGRRYRGFAEAMLAQTPFFGTTDAFGNHIIKEEYEAFVTALDDSLKKSMGFMEQWMDTRMRMAEISVQAAQKETEATRTALDYEVQARANGYAASVEYARAQYEESLALQRKAVEERKRLQKIEEALNTAQQASDIATAIAGLWKSYAGTGIFGTALATAATAFMLGSFAASKIKARQLAKSETYGEGMSEYLDYGGSHASGNDIDFGTKKDGTRRRVERGEMIGVINKRNVAKYGVSEVSHIISSLNKGTFEKDYGLAFAGLSVNTDLTKLEGGVQTLVKQGDRKVVYAGNKTIEYYKNTKRTIRL